MYLLTRVFVVILIRITVAASSDYDRMFHPMERVPIFSMPYIGNIPIPRPVMPLNPTPVLTTKVLNVITKYVMQNPVCIKVSGKKPTCKSRKPQSKFTGVEYTINSSGYSVEDRDAKSMENTLESSLEEGRAFGFTRPTPSLSKQRINEILIEDRLDHLEAILPHYTRRRVFETKTITVTKTTPDYNRATATLLVKNCIPVGMERCPKKKKKKTLSFVGTSVVRV